MKMNKRITFRIAQSVVFFLFVALQLPAQVQNRTIVPKKTISQAEYKRWKKYSLNNNVYVSAYTGLGTYNMAGMRDYQANTIRRVGIDARVNSDFPPYWLYGVAVMQKFDDARVGLNYGKMSTGARSSLSDYSGQFYSDIICEGYKLGFIFEKDINYRVRFSEKLQTGYRIEMGGLYSNIQNKVYALVYDIPRGLIDEWLTIQTGTYYIEPSLYVAYPVTNKTAVRMSAGIMLDIPIEFEMLIDNDWNDERISWTGFRLNFSLIHQL